MLLVDPVEGRHGPLVFIHVPHTGGTFAVSCFAGLREAWQPRAQHVPIWQLRNAHRQGATVFTVVRHPADWYAGCIDYALNIWNRRIIPLKFSEGFHMDHLGASLDIVSGGTFTRRDLLYGLTHLHELTHYPPKIGLTWGEAYPAELLFAGHGFWTVTQHYFLGPQHVQDEHRDQPDLYLHTETLTEDLAALMGEDVSALERFKVHANRNPYGHEPWTDEEYGWIVEADGELAGQWGYPLQITEFEEVA